MLTTCRLIHTHNPRTTRARKWSIAQRPHNTMYSTTHHQRFNIDKRQRQQSLRSMCYHISGDCDQHSILCDVFVLAIGAIPVPGGYKYIMRRRPRTLPQKAAFDIRMDRCSSDNALPAHNTSCISTRRTVGDNSEYLSRREFRPFKQLLTPAGQASPRSPGRARKGLRGEQQITRR